jgi:plastocyanin
LNHRSGEGAGRLLRWAAIVGLALTGAAALPRPHSAPARRHLIEIRGVKFVPSDLSVQRGDTVIWVNRDIVPHTATFSPDSAWKSGPLQQGDSARYLIQRAGDQPYFCEFHPSMTGKLVVQ